MSDHAHLENGDDTAPACLVVRLPDEPEDGWLGAVHPLLEGAEAIVVEASDPFSSNSLDSLLEAYGQLDPQPSIAFRLAALPSMAAARQALGEIRPRRVDVHWSEDLATVLPMAAKLVGDDGVFGVRVPFGAETWFRIPEIARIASEHGAELELYPAQDGALIGLPLAEQLFVVGHLADSWDQLQGDDRPAAVGERAFEDLLADVRQVVRDYAREGVYAAATKTLRGGGTRLSWPELDADCWTDPERAASFVSRVLALRASPSLIAWIRPQLQKASFQDRVAGSPWLRFVLQGLAVDGRLAPAALCLRALYQDPEGREALLEQDVETARQAGIESWIEHFRDALGLTRLGTRRAPFAIKGPRAPDDRAEPDVTVLVPSYRHEGYIVDTMRSVLAQTYPHFKLVVVDDSSPDETVARAKTVDDPRVEVRVNEGNLGLGNSVLRALEQCDTPFVALLNSDDLFHPKRLEACRSALLGAPDAQVVATDLFVIDSDGGQLTHRNASRIRDGIEAFDWVSWFAGARPKRIEPEHLFGDLLTGNFLATSTNLFCRTEFLLEQRDALSRLKYCLDWQVFLEAARTESLLYLPERLAAYRLHADNTVWFREGRRWSYFLEVNRVVSSTLTRFCEDREQSDAATMRTLEHVAERLAANTEVDGLGLYLNQLLGGAQLEQLSESDDVARDYVEGLNSRSELLTRAAYALREQRESDSLFDDLHRLPTLQVHHLLGELRLEELRSLRSRAKWLDDRLQELYRESGDMKWRWDERQNRLSTELDRVSELLTKLAIGLAAVDEDDEVAELQPASSAQELEKRVVEELDRLFKLEWRLNRQLDFRAHLEKERVRLQTEVEDAWDKYSQLDQQLHAARDEIRDLLEKSEQQFAELEATRGTVTTLESERDALTQERDELIAERDGLISHRERLRGQRAQLRAELSETTNALAATRVSWREEVAAIYRSREWRTGRFLWHKLPFVRKLTRFSGRMKRRIVDWRERIALRLRRKRQGAGPSIVAGATSQFPVYSHTFVYQELMSFRNDMDANVQLLYRQDGDLGVLADAFQYLADNRVHVTATREISQRDLAHYQKVQPDRLETLFAALEQASGMARTELESSDELLSAFTFTRRIELLAPDYLHSYFFYDQSLNALVAGWLLGLPRGVSAYADHVLDDWPLKVVRLHLETADIVVATSQRIRDELCAIGGEAIVGKVIVKPNGVDGSRFPFGERPPIEGSLELISVSRLEPKKGLLELVSCIALLRDRGHRVRVHVIGNVDPETPQNLAYREAFENSIEERDLVDAIVLHGYKSQEDLRPLLATSHAFIAPYVETEGGDKDGIPTAVLEAMSAGLPILASDAGSLTEVIDDGVEGFVVPQKDAVAMAAAVEKVLEGADIWELGRNARARFDREFDAGVTDARLHARLREVLAARQEADAG